ncbi:CLUMA_CG014737, isoform A [Clunio marinus]|uniref:CLUMA_CG014737, isoform A n=1 Tax=Clunio marinus TaxID=568069 RepID=A0A1J1IL63_9DIPT|nr:CLUMA_CG014737, isoform A [Clunio marinus]
MIEQTKTKKTYISSSQLMKEKQQKYNLNIVWNVTQIMLKGKKMLDQISNLICIIEVLQFALHRTLSQVGGRQFALKRIYHDKMTSQSLFSEELKSV